jgi:hypothetical protein
LDIQQSSEFSKFVSLSAFDQSLIESRHALDGFMFEKQQKPKPQDNIDMILYNKDKYLRTFKEVVEFIKSFSSKEGFEGEIRIVNCLSDNIFVMLTDYLEKAFTSGRNLNAEHYIGLSAKDYLQNTYSLTYVFPLIKYDNYTMYFRERDTESNLLNDSILISLRYTEDGRQVEQFLSMMFYESGMPECVVFDDIYLFKYLTRIYENLKNHHNVVIQKYDCIDFTGDIYSELEKYSGNYIIKPNPGYYKIPFEVFNNLAHRMNSEDLKAFAYTLLGDDFDEAAMPDAISKVTAFLKKRIGSARKVKQIEVYCREGLIDFTQTGKLTDHPENLPAFDQNEKRMLLEHLYNRNNDPGDDYSLYITESDIPRKDLFLEVAKGVGILIGIARPEYDRNSWKMIFIQNERLASIFCDYLENHIPVNNAIEKDKVNVFLKDLINKQ